MKDKTIEINCIFASKEKEEIIKSRFENRISYLFVAELLSRFISSPTEC